MQGILGGEYVMKKWVRQLFLSMLTIIFTLSFVSCSSPSQNDVTGTATTTQVVVTDKLVIKGLTDKDIEIGTDELKAMPQVEKQATAVDSAGKETDYTIKGPLFDDVLKKYGKSQKDLKGIRLSAGDGYSIEVPENVLKNRDIILALELNGKELDDSSKPVRAVVPDERAMYWVRNLTNIEI
jgi:DMSO/TMAO reductase YedYZ molybdopterin-dependent catalytic subunit